MGTTQCQRFMDARHDTLVNQKNVGWTLGACPQPAIGDAQGAVPSARRSQKPRTILPLRRSSQSQRMPLARPVRSRQAQGAGPVLRAQVVSKCREILRCVRPGQVVGWHKAAEVGRSLQSTLRLEATCRPISAGSVPRQQSLLPEGSSPGTAPVVPALRSREALRARRSGELAVRRQEKGPPILDLPDLSGWEVFDPLMRGTPP